MYQVFRLRESKKGLVFVWFECPQLNWMILSVGSLFSVQLIYSSSSWVLVSTISWSTSCVGRELGWLVSREEDGEEKGFSSRSVVYPRTGLQSTTNILRRLGFPLVIWEEACLFCAGVKVKCFTSLCFDSCTQETSCARRFSRSSSLLYVYSLYALQASFFYAG